MRVEAGFSEDMINIIQAHAGRIADHRVIILDQLLAGDGPALKGPSLMYKRWQGLAYTGKFLSN
jgi:hypothetical protein